VAALTIPTLLQNTNQAELKVAWKRNFASLSSAFLQLANEKGGSIKGLYTADYDGAAQLANDLSTKLSYIKKCTGYTEIQGNCFVSAYTGGDRTLGFVLSNGALIDIVIITQNCDNGTPGDPTNWGGRCGMILTDVNGFKKPNAYGQDTFAASYMLDGRVVPYGSQQDGGGGYLMGVCPSDPGVCAAKYLYE